jgi:SAM-dependent methyltransferase
LPFIKNSVDTIILSMVLHHLKSTHQKNLIKNTVSSLRKDGKIILIEDSYPAESKLKDYSKTIDEFLDFNEEEKQKILSFYDWFGNRLMRNRDDTPLFYNYKTMDGWKKIFERFRVKQIKAEFIGNVESENFCFFPPKAILIFKKVKDTNR